MEELAGLVVRACGGDLDAYGQIVRRFQEMAYGYAYAILGDFHLAEDATQEAFVNAYRDLSQLSEPAAFPGWFRRIVFKRCDRLTRGKKMPTVSLDAAAAAVSQMPEPDEMAASREMHDKVIDAIRSLPQAQREVTTLFYINGYSQKDIAAFLEVPTSTVKNRLAAARNRLKQRMLTMVKKTLREHALPEDFRIVIGNACRTRTTAPSLAWFRDRWILVWQNGVRAEGQNKYDSHYWFMLAESVDGKEWSEPRRLDIPEQAQFRPKLAVFQDQLCILTHCHHFGIRVARSTDLVNWDPGRVMMCCPSGRGDIFADDRYLYIAYPHWDSADYFGDTVELLRSADGGSWMWMKQPAPNRSYFGTVDATGLAHDGRLYVAWRRNQYADAPVPEGAHEPARKVLFVVSDDGGESWSQPVEIGALGTESGTAWRLSMDIAPDGALAVAHSITVVDDLNWTRSATLQMAVSRDDGKTWSAEPIEYASGVTTDPDIAFTPEGELLITGSIGAEEGSHPWVVHSRVLDR